MVRPAFFVPLDWRELGIGELKEDVLKVVRESLSCETLHVLEDEGSGGASRTARTASGHKSRASLRPACPTEREGLARRPAGNEVQLAFEAFEVDQLHVTPRNYAQGRGHQVRR